LARAKLGLAVINATIRAGIALETALNRRTARWLTG
jgi:hypothetical protein